MQIAPFDQRIRDLCDRLSTTADEEQIRSLAAELQEAIHEHVGFIRLMTLKTVKRFPNNDSDSKAAD